MAEIPTYTSIQEKEILFKGRYQRIDTIADFDKMYLENQPRKKLNTLYRGLKEASYKNYTSIQRKILLNHLPSSDHTSLIQQEIDNLRAWNGSLLERYCGQLNIFCTDLYLMSFIQHYGGFTPLLDFSKNLGTALYFATQNKNSNMVNQTYDINNYCSIYMLDVKGPNAIKQFCCAFSETDYFCNDQSAFGSYHQNYHLALSANSYNTIKKKASQHPIYIDDVYMEYIDVRRSTYAYYNLVFSNLNKVAQQGCFVFYDNDLNPLEHELYCIDIHKQILPQIQRRYLKHYTKRTMFPTGRQIITSLKDKLI